MLRIAFDILPSAIRYAPWGALCTLCMHKTKSLAYARLHITSSTSSTICRRKWSPFPTSLRWGKAIENAH